MEEKLNALEKHFDFEAVIGSEVHVQLKTKTKIFCSCPNEQTDIPNKNIDVICCGYPGTLPVLNKEVVNFAIMAGIATNCKINKHNEFARKHYFYADLPKGYQITQSDIPICEDGYIEIKDMNGNPKKIRIKRIHMEEDAGKNIHTDKYGSLVDYNRAGTPLLEIVTYPDMSNPHEVRAYLKELHSIVTAINITTGNMDEGSFRSDTNISVRPKGQKELGTRCELKNINSFKFIHDATEYEIDRQICIIKNGESVRQQTRLWDTKLHQTYAMRDKEDAEDYRYFPDPDLPHLKISDEWIEEIKLKMPALPKKIKEEYIKKYELSEYEAEILYDNKELANYFIKTYNIFQSKLVISWILREVIAIVKDKNIILSEHSFTPEYFASLLNLLSSKKITQKIAQDIFEKCFENGENPEEFANKNNLISEPMTEDQIKKIISLVFEEQKTSVEEYRSGKVKVRGFLVGEIMKKTQGKADPIVINNFFNEYFK